MSETMPSPTDWGQFYQQNLSSQAMFGDRASDATIVTTTVTTPTPSIPSGSAGHLSPEGRVTKPVRRRSRASRRTPTTLLNTDTTNFRAMVQQFTGGPSAPFSASGSQVGAQGFSFGFGPRHQGIVNPNSLVVSGGGGSYYSSQYQQQQQQSHLQPYMLSLSNSGGGDNLLMQRLGNQRVTSMEMSTVHGFNMESGSTQLNPSRTHDQPSITNENRSNNFLF